VNMLAAILRAAAECLVFSKAPQGCDDVAKMWRWQLV